MFGDGRDVMFVRPGVTKPGLVKVQSASRD